MSVFSLSGAPGKPVDVTVVNATPTTVRLEVSPPPDVGDSSRLEYVVEWGEPPTVNLRFNRSELAQGDNWVCMGTRCYRIERSTCTSAVYVGLK